MFEKMTRCRTCGTESPKKIKACPRCGSMKWNSSKMTSCKDCGNIIAVTANACPNCGSRKQQLKFTMSVMGTVFLCMIAFVVVGVSLSGALNRNPTSSTPSDRGSDATQTSAPADTAPEAISVSAVSLWEAYEDNKVSADAVYKDNLVAVSGNIVDIGQDVITKAPCVMLDTGDSLGIYSIQCFFPKHGDQNDLIASLSDGDYVTIYGTCDGTPIMNVQITNCYL